MAQSLESIPNNVDLSSDRRLQRALEQWQPNFLSWWNEVGPDGYQGHHVYLRTAISVEAGGWAHFDYVKMPDYRWGILLEPHQEGRTIGFGDVIGQPVWEEVPGEHRNPLRRIIVTQADTEPASVEQQRLLGNTAPSLYDLRNIFQVNVEEGRHLGAMVYLLQRHFGRDGPENAWRDGFQHIAEVSESLVQPLARPLRRRGQLQRGGLLRRRPQGARPRAGAAGAHRAGAELPHGPSRGRKAGRAGRAAAQR